MVDKLGGVGGPGPVKPVNKVKSINIQQVLDQTMKDLFGLKPTAKKVELDAVGEELKEALFRLH